MKRTAIVFLRVCAKRASADNLHQAADYFSSRSPVPMSQGPDFRFCARFRRSGRPWITSAFGCELTAPVNGSNRQNLTDTVLSSGIECQIGHVWCSYRLGRREYSQPGLPIQEPSRLCKVSPKPAIPTSILHLQAGSIHPTCIRSVALAVSRVRRPAQSGNEPELPVSDSLVSHP